MEKIRIVLIDSNNFARKQIAKALSREPVFNIVCDTENSLNGYLAARDKRPDIVLIDPFLSDGFGLNVVRRIAKQLPSIRQVVLIAVIDVATELELRNLGVRRILTKSIGSKALVKALREAVQG